MILVSGFVAVVVACASIVDIVAGVPFSGQYIVLDICFIIAAAIMLYMCYDAWKDLR